VRVDLNADIGEFANVREADSDERLLRSITSGNIACGAHAGGIDVMRHTVRMAARAAVSIGAHPSFADVDGFGRREMQLEPQVITDLVVQQVAALAAIAQAEGVGLRHVKPHGALYNMSARRADIADAIASAIVALDATLVMVGLPQSELLAAASRRGLSVASEGFADRAYERDGRLTPRHVAGAVLTDQYEAAERAVRMVREGKVIARDGSTISLKVDTICVHGDTPGAADLAAAVREGLEQAGVEVRAL
jgi:UPF0271 protein